MKLSDAFRKPAALDRTKPERQIRLVAEAGQKGALRLTEEDAANLMQGLAATSRNLMGAVMARYAAGDNNGAVKLMADSTVSATVDALFKAALGGQIVLPPGLDAFSLVEPAVAHMIVPGKVEWGLLVDDTMHTAALNQQGKVAWSSTRL